MFFKLSKILTHRVASRASVIRARSVVTIGSTTGFLGLRAVASVPRSIDFRRSCSGVMDRGSFRAGNDLHSYRPVSSSVKRATRDGWNDLGTRRDHIQCSSIGIDQIDQMAVWMRVYFKQIRLIPMLVDLMTKGKKFLFLIVEKIP